MQKCLLEQDLHTRGSTKVYLFVGTYPNKPAKTETCQLEFPLPTQIRSCIKSCASTVAAFSRLDGLIPLCAR